MLKLKWPRGKYNGKRIDGIKISLSIHLTYWNFMPRVDYYLGLLRIEFLCVTVRVSVEYDYKN